LLVKESSGSFRIVWGVRERHPGMFAAGEKEPKEKRG
jgi:hypothetical protein